MNLTKALIAGIAAAIATWLADYVMHGVMMASTYAKYPIFTREQPNPLMFLFVAVFIGIAAALLFAKTRKCWADGVKGGATFGFFLGLVAFFPNFYFSLVLEGFPYFLGWCWGGINLIDFVIAGVVLALIYRQG